MNIGEAALGSTDHGYVTVVTGQSFLLSFPLLHSLSTLPSFLFQFLIHHQAKGARGVRISSSKSIDGRRALSWPSLGITGSDFRCP